MWLKANCSLTDNGKMMDIRGFSMLTLNHGSGELKTNSAPWWPHFWTNKLEDLRVLKRSPDLLNNVKIGQGQLRLIIQTCFVLPYMGNGHFDQVTQK